MSQPPQIDPISVMVAVASLVFASEVANVVGPYLIILFASSIGASFALKARPTTSRMSAVGFYFRVNGLAILLTYSIATFAHQYYPMKDVGTWFAPVSFAIGFVGDRWPAVFRWAVSKLSKFVDIMIKMRDGGGNV